MCDLAVMMIEHNCSSPKSQEARSTLPPGYCHGDARKQKAYAYDKRKDADAWGGHASCFDEFSPWFLIWVQALISYIFPY